MTDIRYPSFVDALRDMDDALSLVFLFATLPTDDKIANAHVKECQRLSAEFQNYVMTTKSLQKVFLSIKGIYYQAEIKGQTITWIVPYAFSQDVPTDVDFRVMSTFLEFYETLLGFINFKLYTDLNLVYPPTLDKSLDDEAAGMNAYAIESVKEKELIESLEEQDNDQEGERKVTVEDMEDRMETLQDKIAHLQEDLEDDAQSDKDAEMEDPEEDAELPVPAAPATSADEIVPNLESWSATNTQSDSFRSLFSKCKFYLNREVPRYSLEFVIRSFGGQVGWDETAGAGSTFTVDDARITHHIIDRPVTPQDLAKFDQREFLQPQWVYDCINAGKMLKTKGYHPGETLPAHLSPFVEAKEGEYIPGVDSEDEEMSQEGVEAESEEDEETLVEEVCYFFYNNY